MSIYQQQLGFLQAQAESLHLESGDLCDAVLDAAEDMAAGVNNSGMEEQVKFIFDSLGVRGTESLLQKLAEKKG